MTDHANQDRNGIFSILQRVYDPVHAIALGPISLLEKGYLSKVDCASITVLDPDRSRVTKWLEENTDNDHINLLNRGCAHAAATMPYYKANISHESGIVRPEGLKSLWQNIETVEEGKVQVSTIDDIAIECKREFNWVFSEVMNAADVLSGLKDQANRIDVIIARTIHDASIAKQVPDYSKPRLDELAASLGMVEVACLPGRHPKTATVIYVRNWKYQHTALEKEYSKAIEDHKQQVEAYDLSAKQLVGSHEVALAQRDESLSEYQNVIADLQGQLSEASAKSEALRAQYEKAISMERDTALALQQNYSELEADLMKSHGQIAELEAREIEQQKQLSAIQKQHDEVLLERDTALELQQNYSELEADLTKSHERIAELEAREIEQQKQLSAIQKQHDEVLLERERSLADLQSAFENAMTELAEHNKMNEEMRKSIDDKDRSVEAERQKVKEKIEEHAEELEDMRRKHDALALEIQKANDAKDISEKQLKLGNNNLNELREQQKVLSDKNLDLTRRLSEISQHLKLALEEFSEPTKPPVEKKVQPVSKVTSKGKSGAVS